MQLLKNTLIAASLVTASAIHAASTFTASIDIETPSDGTDPVGITGSKWVFSVELPSAYSMGEVNGGGEDPLTITYAPALVNLTISGSSDSDGTYALSEASEESVVIDGRGAFGFIPFISSEEAEAEFNLAFLFLNTVNGEFESSSWVLPDFTVSDFLVIMASTFASEAAFQSFLASGGTPEAAQFFGEGFVSGFEIGETFYPVSGVEVVPEPSVYAGIAGLLALGMAVYHRRRRNLNG